MAISTYNTKLSYGTPTTSTGGTYAAPSTLTELDIKDFPSLLGKRSSLETTTLSDDAQTFIPGIRQQEESFDFTANYDKTVLTAIDNLADTLQWCELEFSDGSKYTWVGYISASVNEGSVDAVLEMTISISPSSVPVFVAGQ